MSDKHCKELYCPICQRISGEAGKEQLAFGIARIALSAGIIDGSQPLTGPQLLLLVDDLIIEVERLRGRTTDVPEWQPEAPLLRSILPIEISSANAIAYQLEQGKDNGDLSREVLAVTLRRFAKTFEAANSLTQPTVSPEADNSTTVPDHGQASLPESFDLTSPLTSK